MTQKQLTLSYVSRYLSDRLGIKMHDDPLQQMYVEAMIESTNKTQAIFLDAAAGTGKTSLAISVAYLMLQKDLIDQIIYVRSAVSIRELGFLPGDIAEKEAPYMQPGLDALSRIEPQNKTLIETLINNDQLVIATTAFLRGVDWDERKFLIVDEAQNLNLQELQMVLTRPHDRSKVVVIGSTLQCDDPKARRYGIEKMLPFELYAYHYKYATDIPVKVLELKKNYRGNFSLMADKIQHTIDYLEKPEGDRGELKIPKEDHDELMSAAWCQMKDKIYRR